MEAATTGRETEGRVGTDDQLEGIEGSGQRRAEGSADRARRTRTDQHPQIGAPEVEAASKPRGEAGTELRVAGFEPDRGAKAVGAERLRADDQAIDHRHPATVQGVRLDRIDRAATTDARNEAARHAEKKTAGCRHEREPRIGESIERAERARMTEMVEKSVQERGRPRQGDGEQPGRDADHDREEDEATLAGAHDGPKPSEGCVPRQRDDARRRHLLSCRRHGSRPETAGGHPLASGVAGVTDPRDGRYLPRPQRPAVRDEKKSRLPLFEARVAETSRQPPTKTAQAIDHAGAVGFDRTINAAPVTFDR